MSNVVLLLCGLLLLVLTADRLIDVTAGLARKYRVPELLIGITLVAFGTSLPELAVSMTALIRGDASEIVLGNVIGSNIVNSLLIIGILGIGKSIRVDHTVVKRELLFNIGASLLVCVMVLDHLLETSSDQTLGRIDGILLLTYFGLFMVHIIGRIKGTQQKRKVTKPSVPIVKELSWSALLLGGVVAGGWLTINGALGLTNQLGLSQTFVGSVIVAIGTSLPELTTSVLALKKRSVDIALGNIIGSNLFNILAILGVSALIAPMTVSSRLTTDIIFLLLASVSLFGLVYSGHGKHQLTQRGATLLILLYGCFLFFSILYR